MVLQFGGLFGKYALVIIRIFLIGGMIYLLENGSKKALLIIY